MKRFIFECAPGDVDKRKDVKKRRADKGENENE